MSRKSFMQAHGASNRNDRYGWAFVNHDKKIVFFGAWDLNTQVDCALILSKHWEFNEQGRKQNAFGEALEYIKLVENEGYSLKTFPIIWDDDYDKQTKTGRAKIKKHIEELSDMTLKVLDGEYYAVGNHHPNYTKKPPPNIADDILDIFNYEVDRTERESLILARVGQGKFRQNVIDVWGNGECCALTLTNIRVLLIASHIIPWSQCKTNAQRLDGANGILLCAHIDKLFDSHLLTFIKQGQKYLSKISPKLDAKILNILGVESGQELCVDYISHKHQSRFDEYLKVHNDFFENKIAQGPTK